MKKQYLSKLLINANAFQDGFLQKNVNKYLHDSLVSKSSSLFIVKYSSLKTLKRAYIYNSHAYRLLKYATMRNLKTLKYVYETICNSHVELDSFDSSYLLKYAAMRDIKTLEYVYETICNSNVKLFELFDYYYLLKYIGMIDLETLEYINNNYRNS
jgi:hypothetical protein